MELISREDAKRKIIEELDSIDHVPSWVFRRLERVISSLPTVEERKEGKWIRHVRNDFGVLLNDTITCSLCRVTYPLEHLIHNTYCPNCGAKMDGEDL